MTEDTEVVYVIRPARFRVLSDGTQIHEPDIPSRSASVAVHYAVQQVYFAARRFTRAFELGGVQVSVALDKLVDTIVDWQVADEVLEKLGLFPGATDPGDSQS